MSPCPLACGVYSFKKENKTWSVGRLPHTPSRPTDVAEPRRAGISFMFSAVWVVLSVNLLPAPNVDGLLGQRPLSARRCARTVNEAFVTCLHHPLWDPCLRPLDSMAMGSGHLGRRAALPVLAAALAASASVPPRWAHAADAPKSANGAPKVWLSGKSDPLRPTSKDKPDGTRKDPKYLSCLNDCVPRCQGSSGSKDRSDCFDECQDECCFTYQQCTAPRVRL